MACDYGVAGVGLKAEAVFAAGKAVRYIARVSYAASIDQTETDSAFEAKGYIGVAYLAVG